MPIRGFRRSNSEALPPNERAYRRAARELRDFHRARSLDVILEEDHLDQSNSSSGGGLLKTKRAVLCLADLVNEPEHTDGSDGTTDEQDFAGGSNSGTTEQPACWGHFTQDSPSSEQERARIRAVPHMPALKPIRRFGRS